MGISDATRLLIYCDGPSKSKRDIIEQFRWSEAATELILKTLVSGMLLHEYQGARFRQAMYFSTAAGIKHYKEIWREHYDPNKNISHP